MRRNLDTIAVVRTDRLGDMALTLPLLGALRRALPEARLGLVARSYVAPLVEDCPVVDRVEYADRLRDGVSEALAVLRPDVVFFPRPRFSEALAAVWRRIPVRVGSLYRLYSPLFSIKIPEHRSDALRHEAEYNVRMAQIAFARLFPGRFPDELFATELVRPAIQPDAAASVREKLLAAGVNPDTPFVVIHPGSGGSTPVWPAENFGRVAALFTHKTAIPVVITGVEAEREVCDAAAVGAANLCGRLSLAEMIALLGCASAMLANSTGTLHVAAALGTSVVGLYPNSPAVSPRRWRPYSPNAMVITPPDGSDRMELIAPEAAAEALERAADSG